MAYSVRSQLFLKIVNDNQIHLQSFDHKRVLPPDSLDLFTQALQLSFEAESIEILNRLELTNQRLEAAFDSFIKSGFSPEETALVDLYLKHISTLEEQVLLKYLDFYKRKNRNTIDDLFYELKAALENLKKQDHECQECQHTHAKRLDHLKPHTKSTHIMPEKSLPQISSSQKKKSSEKLNQLNLAWDQSQDPGFMHHQVPDIELSCDRRCCESDGQSPSISNKSHQEHALSVQKKKKPKPAFIAIDQNSKKGPKKQTEAQALQDTEKVFFQHEGSPKLRKTSTELLENSPSIISSITKDERRIIQDRAASFDILMRNAKYLKSYLKDLPLKKQEIQYLIQCIYFDNKSLVRVLEENRIEKNNTKTLNKVRELIQEKKRKPRTPVRIKYSPYETFKFLALLNLLPQESLPILKSLNEHMDEKLANLIFDFETKKDLAGFATKLTDLAKEISTQKQESNRAIRDVLKRSRDSLKASIHSYDICSSTTIERESKEWQTIEAAKRSILFWHDVYYNKERSEYLRKVDAFKTRS